MKGWYLYENGWVKIIPVTDDSAIVTAGSVSISGIQTTPIVTMNEIELSGDTVVLSSLEISLAAFTRYRRSP